MVIAAFIKGMALGLLLCISVGPVIFSIIKQSINNGHKGGFFFIAGVSASDVTIVLICNLFSALFQSAMNHERLIGIAGSIFLVCLGTYNCFFRKSEVAATADVTTKVFRKRDLAGIFFSGYLMNTLNPGVFIFWFAAAASIIADAKLEVHPIQYRIIVFSTCLLLVLFSDVLKVFGANKIRSKLTPHNIHIINRISGLIMIGFGVVLAWRILTNAPLAH
ncbi:LysE family translocator [Filimonas effusa]|uniref:Lysine transporter LysE n=1 Tax=Filimonas effusa TaxID=2508721 RepID=A0A4Q1D636_9BACT|nr:LysE family transporter [Filimonas effusa]RXK83878.1 lysine transporter LysE [Filimonas effusa]